MRQHNTPVITFFLTAALALVFALSPARALAAEYLGETTTGETNTYALSDTLEQKALKLDTLSIPTGDELQTFQLSTFFRMPVALDDYRGISQYFSRVHSGIDIRAKFNAKVTPVLSGKVSVVDYETGGYGNYVVVDHENGLRSLYAHMNKPKVKVGDVVSDADLLGTVGMTGRTTGPHIHLEMYKKDRLINPALVIPLNVEAKSL